MNATHDVTETDPLTREDISRFMEMLGFVESRMAGETVWLANLSVSIRVDSTKGFNSKNHIKTEVYKRVAYHRDEFLKQLDAILLFCLSDMQGFDPRFTKEDTAKRARLGVDVVRPMISEKSA